MYSKIKICASGIGNPTKFFSVEPFLIEIRCNYFRNYFIFAIFFVCDLHIHIILLRILHIWNKYSNLPNFLQNPGPAGLHPYDRQGHLLDLRERSPDPHHHPPPDEHERLLTGPARHDRWERVQRAADQGALHPVAAGQHLHAEHAVLLCAMGV